MPFDHTGARVNYAVDGWTFSGAIYTGWDDVDGNDEKSVSASASFALGAVSGEFLYFGGVERPSADPEGLAWRHLIDAYVTVSLGGPELALHVDGGVEDNDIDTNQWIGAALYARVPIIDGLRLAARGDFLTEAHGGASPIFGLPDDWVASATITLDWHGVDHLRVVLEYRRFHPSANELTLGATTFF